MLEDAAELRALDFLLQEEWGKVVRRKTAAGWVLICYATKRSPRPSLTVWLYPSRMIKPAWGTIEDTPSLRAAYRFSQWLQTGFVIGIVNVDLRSLLKKVADPAGAAALRAAIRQTPDDELCASVRFYTLYPPLDQLEGLSVPDQLRHEWASNVTTFDPDQDFSLDNALLLHKY